MLTASKDGSWRLWDTDIRFQQGQEPHLVAAGSLHQLRFSAAHTVKAALAPNGESFAISAGTQLQVYQWKTEYSTENGDTLSDGSLEDVHQESISGLRFSSDSKFLVTCGDKHLRVFNNMAYYKALARNTALELMKTHGEAHKERLRQQMKEAKGFLKQILGEI